MTCTCSNGTPTVASGNNGSLCDVPGEDCSTCDANYFLDFVAAPGSHQTCGTKSAFTIDTTIIFFGFFNEAQSANLSTALASAATEEATKVVNNSHATVSAKVTMSVTNRRAQGLSANVIVTVEALSSRMPEAYSSIANNSAVVMAAFVSAASVAVTSAGVGNIITQVPSIAVPTVSASIVVQQAPAAPNTISETKTASSLSSGAMAGIIVGCIITVALVTMLVIMMMKQHALNKVHPTTEGNTNANNVMVNGYAWSPEV